LGQIRSRLGCGRVNQKILSGCSSLSTSVAQDPPLGVSAADLVAFCASAYPPLPTGRCSVMLLVVVGHVTGRICVAFGFRRGNSMRLAERSRVVAGTRLLVKFQPRRSVLDFRSSHDLQHYIGNFFCYQWAALRSAAIRFQMTSEMHILEII